MARRHMTRAEVIKVDNIFAKYLVPTKDGFFKYLEDWSDAKVASEIDPAIQANAVSNLRVELFGKLDTTMNVSREDTFVSRNLKP